jgi:hypothetical protein
MIEFIHLGKDNMNEYKFPQLEKFSLLLKIKLVISVIYDVIGLLVNTALSIALAGLLYWAFAQLH